MPLRPAADRFAESELTQGQLLIWSGQRLEPDNPLYNMAFTFRVEAELDLTCFEQALANTIADCDALRTVVGERDGVPFQRVYEEASFALEVIDCDGEAPRAQAEARAQERCEAPFRLDHALFDTALYRLADGSSLWYLNLHHLITDAWSTDVLVRRVSAHYLRLCAGGRDALPSLPAFASYAQLERAERGALAEGATEAYWRDVAAAVRSPPSLYGARQDGGGGRTSRSARLVCPVDAARWAALEARTQAPEARALTRDLSRFNLIATLVFAYLYRVGGQRVLALAAPAHNRMTADARETVGLLTEVFPLQVEVAAGDRFLDLLRKVQLASNNFLRHARPGASDARFNRGCRAVLNVIRSEIATFGDAPIETRWLHPGHHDHEHDLRFHVHDFAGSGAYALHVDLNEAVFPGVRKERALGHFVRLLDALLDDWEQPIDTVDLLSEEERQQQLRIASVEVAAGAETGEAGRGVLERFSAQVVEHPGAPALVMGPVSLTYAEVDGLAGTLAAWLIRRYGGAERPSGSAQPEPARVGICMRRSPHAVIAMLAALRAGVAYVPIDPHWPAERIAYVLGDAGAMLVLVRGPESGQDQADDASADEPNVWQAVEQASRHRDPSREPSRVISLPRAFDAWVDLDGRDQLAVGTPAVSRHEQPDFAHTEAAYVLYTSGSTGEPKGAVVSHAALDHYVGWARAYYDCGQRLTFPLFSPLTFDLTVTSIFVPLTAGGTVRIYPETGARTDLALLDVFAEDAVDIIKLTPSHTALLDEGPPDGARQHGARVRQLIVGGEALSEPLVARLRDRFAGLVALHNEYGPTEATVGCVVHTVAADSAHDPIDAVGARRIRAEPGERSGERAVPIGRPIAGMQAYVLGTHLDLLPAGVEGELWLAGDGLAQGYLGQAALTATRFVPNPFAGAQAGQAGQGGSRLYRTGDLVRWNDEGQLVFRGRNDDQVKLRGARIELGEGEAAVLRFRGEGPAVAACAARVVGKPASKPPKVEVFCSRCALPSGYPGVTFDASGVCSQCHAFEGYRHKVERYFETPEALVATLDRARSVTEARGDDSYDCIALLSGGKDSTYMVCRLVDLGYRVLAFTLDNGYLSDQAKENIERVAEALGIDHHYAATPAMNEIFVDSLERHANVCQGCFKTLYTLSMQKALEEEIPFVVTGLSRGQFFETRLTEEVFTDPQLDIDQIDETVLRARKAYHRVDDEVRRLLDVSMFDDEKVFEQVQFVDFYRYVSVGLDDLYAYLQERVPWKRPTDTGRSTNCLINDVGIYIHQRERGFHNYAWPYSWDVRLDQKSRAAALDELHDEIDPVAVDRILGEIGYSGRVVGGSERLVVYFTPKPESRERAGADQAVSLTSLRAHLVASLPDHMVPAQLVPLDVLPLTAHGKVDTAALPLPGAVRPDLTAAFIAPRTGIERSIAGVWSEVLGVDRVGVQDHYLDLGGDSIMAIQIVARCHRLGLRLTPTELFDAGTVEVLARRCLEIGAGEDAARAPGEEGDGAVALLPAQQWLLTHSLAGGQSAGQEGATEGASAAVWNHVLVVNLPADLDIELFRQALERLPDHHEALRLRFEHAGEGWRAIRGTATMDGLLSVHDTTDPDELMPRLHASLDVGVAPLLRAAIFPDGAGGKRLALVAHHLIVDAVSWTILLEDWSQLYQQLLRQEAPRLPPASVTLDRWSQALARASAPVRVRPVKDPSAADDSSQSVVAIPRDFAGASDGEAWAGTFGDADTVTVSLEPAATRALVNDLPGSARVRPHEVLLAALARTFAEDSPPGSAVRVFVEGFGREPLAAETGLPALEAYRVMGWLTSIQPVVLGCGRGRPEDLLREVKDRWRALPTHGVAASVAREAHSGVVFNYLGRADRIVPQGTLFGFDQALALHRSDHLKRPFLLEVDAWVVAERLQVTWSFSTRCHRPASIERLAARFLEHLRMLIDHGAGRRGSEARAEDFPLANLDATKLGKLAAVLGSSAKNAKPTS